jgi:hypothetical protein
MPTTYSSHQATTPHASPAFLIGPYTLEVTLYSGVQTETSQNVSVISKTTLAVPYSLLAFVLVILSIVAAFESKKLRIWVKKVLDRASER